MTSITICGAEIESINEFHAFLKKEWELPAYYGENLDALWDCITGWIDLPVKVTWKDIEKSRERLGEKFVDEVLNLFEEAKRELGKDFDYVIL